MRRQRSRDVADWLLAQLLSGEFATYIQGPQGVGKSHLLYDAVLLVSATHGCRVVYEHDCTSWGSLNQQPIQATLYFLRSVAMAFASDAAVLNLCNEFTAKVAVMSTVADAEFAVSHSFLPQLGDLCKTLNLKVFSARALLLVLDLLRRSEPRFSLRALSTLHRLARRGVRLRQVVAQRRVQQQLHVGVLEQATSFVRARKLSLFRLGGVRIRIRGGGHLLFRRRLPGRCCARFTRRRLQAIAAFSLPRGFTHAACAH
jgi:hypothetical protein